MDFLERYYPESRFGGFSDVDGTIAFHARVNALIEPHMVILEVGCGRGAPRLEKVKYRRDLRIYKGKVKTYIGIDVDEGARENPYLDEFRLITDNWPVENESIDLCICESVLEHISDIDHFFSEFNRVLKKDGLLCMRTPNLLNYIHLIAYIIPSRFHADILKKAQSGRREEDVFPTYYKCNTIRKLRRTLETHGFKAVVYGYEAEPRYLQFSKFAYFLGVLHQRYAPRMFKSSIFVFSQKI